MFVWGSLMKLWLYKIIKSDLIKWVKKTQIINGEDRKVWGLSTYYPTCLSKHFTLSLLLCFKSNFLQLHLIFLMVKDQKVFTRHFKMSKCCYMAGSDKNREQFQLCHKQRFNWRIFKKLMLFFKIKVNVSTGKSNQNILFLYIIYRWVTLVNLNNFLEIGPAFLRLIRTSN